MNTTEKLEEFLRSPKAEEAFSGTTVEILEKLKNEGIDLTEDGLKAFVRGINDAANDELTEEDLTDVAGGKTYPGYEQDCYNAGRKLCKVLKWLFSFGKNFVS